MRPTCQLLCTIIVSFLGFFSTAGRWVPDVSLYVQEICDFSICFNPRYVGYLLFFDPFCLSLPSNVEGRYWQMGPALAFSTEGKTEILPIHLFFVLHASNPY